MLPSLSIVKKELGHLNELKNFVTTGINMTNSIASDLQLSEELPGEEIQVLEECILDFIKLERDMKQFEETANIVKDMMSDRDENCGNVEIDDTLDSVMREMAKRNSNQALKQHEAYEKFLSLIQHSDDKSDKILGEEEDMMVVGESGSVRDPITKQEICDPVKNVHCGHIYSRESILKYMKIKDRVKCPYVGCSNPRHLQQKDISDAVDIIKKR